MGRSGWEEQNKQAKWQTENVMEQHGRMNVYSYLTALKYIQYLFIFVIAVKCKHSKVAVLLKLRQFCCVNIMYFKVLREFYRPASRKEKEGNSYICTSTRVSQTKKEPYYSHAKKKTA